MLLKKLNEFNDKLIEIINNLKNNCKNLHTIRLNTDDWYMLIEDSREFNSVRKNVHKHYIERRTCGGSCDVVFLNILVEIKMTKKRMNLNQKLNKTLLC